METQRRRKTANGVNGIRSKTTNTSPGDVNVLSQASRDRHPVTVTNSTDQQPRNAKIIRTTRTKIGTWNVQTLFQVGKLDNVIIEMDRMGLACLGLCEVRWTDSGDFKKNDKRVLYSGGASHHRGVGLILNKNFSNSVISYWPKSDRIMFVKLKASPYNINIIVIYAPTSDAEDEAIESFYDELDQVYRHCKPKETTIVLGD